ncbi:MAG: peptidase M28, partial [Gemmatimonadetes bacterium]|nr:peptidase M28 [Gemmatimonadota bacterium]
MSLSDNLLADTSFDLGWSLIERFAVLVRESGSIDERAAAHFITSRLEVLGVPFELHEPDLYLSIPRSASVDLDGTELAAKPPSFSVSTGPKGLSAAPVHVPAAPIEEASELFKAAHEGEMPDVAG